MKKITSLATSFLLILSLGAYCQNVGINATGAIPNNSAILDLNTGNTFTSPNGKGLLPTNVSLTSIIDVVTVTSPATSLLIYNTATAGSGTAAVLPGYYYWNGIKWVAFDAYDWRTAGNVGTIAGINFVGTTDAQDLVFKTNSIENMRVTNGGNVGIGTATPASSLHIVATTTNTGFQLQDGTQGSNKILTSDAAGKASWVSGQTVNLITSVPNAITISSCLWTDTGETITLPTVGFYIVMSNIQEALSVGVTGGYAEIRLDNGTGVFAAIPGTNYLSGAPSGLFVKIGGTFFIKVTTPGTFRVFFACCPNPAANTNWTSMSHLSAFFYSN